MTLTPWIASACLLTVGMTTCGIVAFRRGTFPALVALELAGTLATLVLVCLVVGFQRAVYGDLPVIAAVLNWVGSLVYVRFLDRSRA